MNNNEIELIIKVLKNMVIGEQGCKETVLIARITSAIANKQLESHLGDLSIEDRLNLIDIYSKNLEVEIINKAMEELIDRKEVLYITYTLPLMKYRTKSLIFPKGTEFEIHE